MRQSLVSLPFWASLVLSAATSYPVKLETRGDLTSHLTNVHISFSKIIDGAVTFTYGSCTTQSRHEAHHIIGESEGQDFSRLVWVIPRDAQTEGCISAWTKAGSLVGRSESQRLHKVKRRAPQKRDDRKLDLGTSQFIHLYFTNR